MANKRFLLVPLVILISLVLSSSVFASKLVTQTWLPGTQIRAQYGQFVDEVPRPGRVDGANDLTITESEFQQKMLPSTFPYPSPFEGTYVWGFGAQEKGPYSYDTVAPHYPGPTVVTESYPKEDSRSRAHVLYDNQLYNHEDPNAPLLLQQYLTVDQTLHWANPLDNTSPFVCFGVDCQNPVNRYNACCQPYLGPVPVTVHLHGAETPSAFDGHPDTWWTPNLAQTGPSFVDNNFTYTNTMQPTALWYHDHALGMTRINIYSGLAGFYFIRGTGDTGDSNSALRLPSGEHELELLIADRMFDTNGQLIFPDGTPTDDPIGLNDTPPNADVHPYWIPEFFGDVNVVNGKVWPKMTVEPRRYRFRILNGANARFYNLKLSASVRESMPRKLGRDNPKPVFWVIGTDGGLLDQPVKASELLIGPAERYDIIIDFKAFRGYDVEITNDANAPFPDGDTLFDPDTIGKVMQFQVSNDPVFDNSFNPALPGARLRGGKNKLPPIVRLVDGKGGLAPGVTPAKIRQLVLKEIEGPGGPLEVLLNNTKWNGKRYGMDEQIPGSEEIGAVFISELPVVGSTELWEIINLTEDAHPIHIHLGQFQLMNRQAFNVGEEEDGGATGYTEAYNKSFPGGEFIPEYGPPADYETGKTADGTRITPYLGGNPDVTPYLTGPVMPPKAYEFGWKDTWVMLPGQVTRIVVRIAPQKPAVDEVDAGQNEFAFDPTTTLGQIDSFGFPGGPGYIWHCHLLDHEDNEMMRPYIPVNLGESE